MVNTVDGAGYTALHYFSFIDNQSPDIRLENAKLLLQAGATPTIKNKSQETPYENARSGGKNELAKFLWSQLSPEQQAQENRPPADW